MAWRPCSKACAVHADAKGNGVTEFEMTEVFSGVMLPMIKEACPIRARVRSLCRGSEARCRKERVMAQVMVRYKVKADRIEEHEGLIRKVFAELAESAPPGIRYGAFKLADGVSFVHIALITADKNPLDTLPAFKAFGEQSTSDATSHRRRRADGDRGIRVVTRRPKE